MSASPSSFKTIQESIPTHVKLIAVSKLQNIESIRNLYQKGQRDFAENYVQEFIEKYDALKDLNINWHFIGHLQKNKIKYILGKAKYIHSIDSISLLKELNKKLSENNLIQNIFLQFNIANEDTKGGFKESEVDLVIKELNECKNINLCGLMIMPPLHENPELSRSYFKKIKMIQKKFQQKFANCSELSMGTSTDYKVAIEEGSTMLRLGTILFGERIKKV